MFIFNIAPVHPVHSVNSFLTLLSEASYMGKKKSIWHDFNNSPFGVKKGEGRKIA